MIFMHIYALFAQNRRCPLTGWRKHAHPSLPPSLVPLPRKRIPEKRFENFQSSEPSGAEPSRAARSRHVGYIFFFFPLSLSTFHPLPSLPVQSGASIPFDGETGRSTGALSLFSPEGGRERISAKAGSNGWWWQKEKNSILSPPPSLARRRRVWTICTALNSKRALARAQTRFVVCVYVCVYVCVCVLYRNATRTWPKAGISLISFPAALPAEVAIKIVWKGGRYAYNEYPGVLRFSCGGEREGGIRSGRKGVACHAVVFCGFLELGREGGIMRRGRWELTGVNSWMEEEEEKDRFSKES